MSRVSLIVLALVACSAPAAGQTKTPLEQAFLQPSPQARPWVYWYWMNSNVTRDGIIADLKAMQEVDVGGVFLMDEIRVPMAQPADRR